MYDYRTSVKSDVSDELINTYLLRPIAGKIVQVLYPTSVTPNQVTVASTVAGLLAAFFFLRNDAAFIATGGILVTLKDILDSADGQLARAKNQYSRIGRFLDSIGDAVVSTSVFVAIGWMLSVKNEDVTMLFLALLGLVGITLRVSYHVFYHTSFLHLEKKYQINRITEEVTKENLQGDRFPLTLQKIFQLVYGWQDRFMMRIDAWCREKRSGDVFLQSWYSDVLALRLSGLLGFGTELFVLTVCAVLNVLELYLVINILLMNALFAACVFYRWVILRTRLASS